MRFQLRDSVEVLDGGLRETGDGFMVGTARVARAGNIQIYGGSELGRPDLREVRVYRPADEVFSLKTMQSVAHRPITLDHPREPVDSASWRGVTRGQLGDEVARDGDFIRVPLVLMDAAAIGEYKRGKRELSLGYTCDLAWEPGKTADGKDYDAVQKDIRVNHLAIVGAARGGPELTLGDREREEREMTTENRRVVKVDGLDFRMDEQGAQIVEKLQRQVTDADARVTAADAKTTAALAELADAKTKISTLEAEKATLSSQLTDATKPEVLQAAADAAKKLRDAARALVPGITLDGKSDADIRKAVVDSKLGDAAKTFTADQYSASFATLSAKVLADAGGEFARNLGSADLIDGGDTIRDAAINKRNAALGDAWKGEPPALKQ